MNAYRVIPIIDEVQHQHRAFPIASSTLVTLASYNIYRILTRFSPGFSTARAQRTGPRKAKSLISLKQNEPKVEVRVVASSGFADFWVPFFLGANPVCFRDLFPCSGVLVFEMFRLPRKTGDQQKLFGAQAS